MLSIWLLLATLGVWKACNGTQTNWKPERDTLPSLWWLPRLLEIQLIGSHENNDLLDHNGLGHVLVKYVFGRVALFFLLLIAKFCIWSSIPTASTNKFTKVRCFIHWTVHFSDPLWEIPIERHFSIHYTYFLKESSIGRQSSISHWMDSLFCLEKH